MRVVDRDIILLRNIHLDRLTIRHRLEAYATLARCVIAVGSRTSQLVTCAKDLETLG